MRVAPEWLRDDLFELRFYIVDRLAWCEPSAVANPEDMGVDGECLLAERCVEHHVGRLATDAWQSLQLLSSSRDLTAMIVDECLAERDDVLRLGVE